MGMSSSDDETAIWEREELRQWAEDFPETPWGYDHQPTEDEKAFHNEDVRRHVARKPRRRTGYEGERR